MIAVGPGAPDKEGKVVPTNVQAGDRVLLPGWGGNSIKVGEDVSCIFNLKDCLDIDTLFFFCRNISSSVILKSLPRLKSETCLMTFLKF